MKTFKPFYNVLFYIVVAVCSFLQFLIYPLQIIGRENLPAGGFVLAPNHLRAMDPVFIVLTRRFAPKMLILGKQDLFTKNIFLNFFWNVVGVIPIRRGKGDTAVLNSAVEEVKNGRGLLIFPEGTRSKDGQLGAMKSGAFVVAQQAGVPVVPCRIWYKTGKATPFAKVAVVFGKPITAQELGIGEEYRMADLRAAKRRFAEILTALYEDNKEKL